MSPLKKGREKVKKKEEGKKKKEKDTYTTAFTLISIHLLHFT
jgi:hypothetical protein